MGYHLYISTGETSGEQHAHRFVDACREIAPETTFSGMGTERLQNAGVDCVVDSSEIQVMGFWEVVKHLPAVRRAFNRTVQHIKATRPDAVVLVDYPGFHLRLAKALRKQCPGVPVLYYIAPKVWAWNTGRVKQMRKVIDLLLCIFPFEERWFGDREVRASFVGNPTLDAVRGVTGDAVRAELGVGEGQRLISIFPGSRRREIASLLPPLLQAAEVLKQENGDLEFAIAAAPGFSREILEENGLVPGALPVVEGKNLELLAASDFVLAKSGTTTLEAALLGKPMLAVYRGSWLSAAIARRVVKIPHFTLPNILAGKEVIPELFQEQVNAGTIAATATAILNDPARYDTMQREFAAIRRSLGDEPAARRAASVALAYLGAEEGAVSLERLHPNIREKSR